MKPADIIMWMVKSPNGMLQKSRGIHRTREGVIKTFERGYYSSSWKSWYSKGWRIVKVKITEL